MKKNLSGLLLLVFILQSQNSAPSEYARQSESCCLQRCCECSLEPLCPCSFDFAVEAGVAPVLWRNRDAIQASSCSIAECAGVSPLFSLVNHTPSFSRLFHVPFDVSAQLGYAWCSNIRTYIGFDYIQAHGKNNVLINSDALTSVNTVIPLVFNFNTYKLFDAYVGFRYYTDRWCNRYSLFLGPLLGVARHKNIYSSISFSNPIPTTPLIAALAFYASNTVLCGGADMGLDICLTGNWSLVLTARAIASCGPRAVNNLDISAYSAATGVSITNLSIGGMETEIRFPLTIGFRYTF